MKKALAFILASFVFASVFFKSIPAKASDFAIPESGWLPVIYDIFYSLVNGNEIDVVNLAGELSGINAVINNYDEYRNTHFETGIEGALSLLNNSLFTYASCMYEGDLYDLAAQYSVYLKDGLHPILGRYTTDRVARWNQYNTQYNDKYLNSFAPEEEVVYPNPDINYIEYLNRMNNRDSSGYDFFFYDYTLFTGGQGYTYTWSLDNITDYSYFRVNNYNQLVDFPISGSKNYISLQATDLISINITGSNDSYSTQFSFNLINPVVVSDWNNQGYNSINLDNLRFRELNVNNLSGTYTYSNTGTLDNIISDLSYKFKNVNIYVNGTAWSLVDFNAPEELVIGPDVIRNDNGLIDSQDVFVPDQELAFDLIGLINLLEDALQNQNTLTFDDIINDGTILRNPDGSALDDARAHILQNTIQRVIADEFQRDDPEPIPTTTPPPYPTFPEVDWRKNPIPEPLPTGFDTSNGNPADAFSGASTLAQIVDATNRGLPSELVYTFWGIVFGMIVLGIIKVLHK